MTAIWLQDASGTWSQQEPTPYDNEQALHDIVMQTPDLLPLSGSPRLTVIGREVALRWSGYVDVLALEGDGRPVIIEVKLRNNVESRRAVVAQALSYAASLHGLSRADFEQTVAGPHLDGRTLFGHVQETMQGESLPQPEFEASLATHLADGSFRVVIVLDEAPTGLVNLVGYLESVTTGLSLDLIAVHSYNIGGRRIAVPQRLDPEHQPDASGVGAVARTSSGGHLEPGVEPFRLRIKDAPEEHRPILTLMADWADALVRDGRITGETYFGTRGGLVLLPRLRDERVGLVSLWMNSDGSPAVSLWRSVFERRAPQFIGRVEALIAPKSLGQGTTTGDVTEELMDVLQQAYFAAI